MSDDHEMYGRMPVVRMFVRCAIPGMIAMLVWSACSIADGIFVGNVLGWEALAALNMVWPILTMVTAVSDMIATGSSVRISMSLGSGDERGARVMFTNSMLIILGMSIVFMVFGLFGAEWAMKAMGADATLAALGAEYMGTFALFAPIALMFFATDNYLRICGKVNFSMYINVLVAVLNIALDALFLVGFGWGLWSAALATALSMSLGAAISLVPFVRRTVVLTFVRGRMGRRNLWNIMYNGSSTFFNSISGSVFMMFANIVLLEISGAPAVSAFGIMMYINSLASSLFAGMSMSIQPAISYNHGSGDGTRVGRITYVLSVGSILMAVLVLVLVLLFNEGLVGLFIDRGSTEIIDMATHGMAIFSLSYLTSWMAINVNQVLTSVDRPGQSLVIGVLSQMVIPIAVMAPMAFIGLDGVWWSFVIASAVSMAISSIFLVRARKDGIFDMHDPVPGHVSSS